ncbi:MAG: XdhC family protein [Pyrinomonadaceae bacterium]
MAANKTNTQTALHDAIRMVLHEGSTAVLVTVIESDSLKVGSKLLIRETGEAVGDLGDPGLNEATLNEASRFLLMRDGTRASRVGEFAADLASLSNSTVLFERIENEPCLVVGGAGHVGASLARLASLVGYQVTLIDDRAEFVARELFASPSEQEVNLVAADSWPDALRVAVGKGRAVSVAIVTRGHKQDEDCLRAAVAANPDYIGMIGSRRRTNIVLDKLREEGFPEEQLKKVRAPIGLDIGAVSPEEVALAILAEIVAERRGGAGGSLSAWRRP